MTNGLKNTFPIAYLRKLKEDLYFYLTKDDATSLGFTNVIDYSLTRNYMQLVITRNNIFILCNFAGLRVIGETSISRK